MSSIIFALKINDLEEFFTAISGEGDTRARVVAVSVDSRRPEFYHEFVGQS